MPTLNESRFNESVVEEAALRWFEELGYPPDLAEEATKTVLTQAELLCADWGS